MSLTVFFLFVAALALAWYLLPRITRRAPRGPVQTPRDASGSPGEAPAAPVTHADTVPWPSPPPVAACGDMEGWRPGIRENLAPEELARLTAMIRAFPDLPVGTRQIMSALQDPATTAQQIARIAGSDPALATRILRVVNSSFYNLPHRISDLSRAIVLLGYVQVRNLVLHGGLGQALVAKDGTRIDTGSFWFHSFCSATCAFHFARKLGTVSPGQASTVALLHDIGKPAFWWSDPATRDGAVDGATASTREILAAEESRFGVNHATLGALLAVRWGLPSDVVRGIEHHHHPGCGRTGDVPADVRDLATVLWMADRFAHRFASYMGDEIEPRAEGAFEAACVEHEETREILARWDASALPALVDQDLHTELLRARALLEEHESTPVTTAHI